MKKLNFETRATQMLRNVFGNLATSFSQSMVNLACVMGENENYDGLAISNPLAGEDASARFMPTVISALDFIREKDPLRYGRLVNSLEAIRNMPGESQPVYHPPMRSCHLNFQFKMSAVSGWFDARDSDDAELEEADFEKALVASMAITLIHESTHGYLWDRGIEYSDEIWKRVEQRCRREEFLFAKRSLEGAPGYLGGTMDWGYWCDFPLEMEAWYEAYRQRTAAEIRSRKIANVWGSDEDVIANEPDISDYLPEVVDPVWFTQYVSQLERKLSRTSNDPAAFLDRAEKWKSVGLHARSLDDCRKAHAICPDSRFIQLTLVSALTFADQWEEGLELATEWFSGKESLGRNEATCLHWLAWCQLRLSHPDADATLCRLACHEDLSDAMQKYYQSLRVRPMIDCGNREEALAHLEDHWNEDRCLCGLMSSQHNLLLLDGQDIEALERREWFLQYRCDSKNRFEESFERLPAHVLDSSHDLTQLHYSNPATSLLIGCDGRLQALPEKLGEVAATLSERMLNAATPESERLYLQAALEGVRNSGARCFRIPESWTGGFEVYISSANIPRACLQNGVLSQPQLWVMALPWRWLESKINVGCFENPYAYSTETEFANLKFGVLGVFPEVAIPTESAFGSRFFQSV